MGRSGNGAEVEVEAGRDDGAGSSERGLLNALADRCVEFRNRAGKLLVTDDVLADGGDVNLDELRKYLDENELERRQRKLRGLIDGLDRPTEDPFETNGVLLKDEICFFVEECSLIDPNTFDEDRLKPASYQLRVGSRYSVGGEIGELNDGAALKIPPFQVAVIQTKERLNLPHFIIGRWNIKVGHAYDGLLWVGGPQVDPGYSGHLFCPIYNLSNSTVHLSYKDELAVIDFIKTTPFREGGREDIERRWDPDTDREVGVDWDGVPKPERYKDDMRGKDEILFEDYDPDQVQSGLVSEVEDRFGGIEDDINRLDRVVRLSFAAFATIFAVLFGVLSLLVSSEFSITAGLNLVESSLVLIGVSAAILTAVTIISFLLYQWKG